MSVVLGLGIVLGMSALRAEPSDGPQVEIFVNQPRPAADETVELTYTFSGAGIGSFRLPRELPLRNLTVVWGPATSTRVEFINLEVKRSVSITYRLRPQGPGQAEIGESTWNFGDKTVKAHSYLLEVGPAKNPGAGPGQAAPRAPKGQREEEEEDPFPSPFRSMEPRGVRNVATRPRDALVTYIVTPDRTTAYAGEEIVLHYELITQADISGLDFVEPPKFPGFWAEDIERPTQPQGRQDTYDGRAVTRFTLLKKAISGLTAGTFTIPPATVKLAVRLPGDPFIDPFAFARPQIVERSTRPIEVKILPIPDNPTFKGPVGTFQVSASTDRTRVGVGDALTLRVKISGSGNLRTATESPHLDIPNARVYPPTPKSNTSRAGGRASASAEWDYVIVPSAAGELVIPPVSFSVFDPSAKKVVRRESQPVRITVEGSTTAAAAGSTPLTSTPAPDAGAALTLPAGHAGTPAAVLVQKPETKGTPLATVDLSNQTVAIPLWLIAAIPVTLLVAGGAAVAVRRHRRTHLPVELSLTPEPGETKERTAARIDRALRTVLARKCDIADSQPVPALLTALEQKKGVGAETLEEVKRLFDDLDFLRFAPQLGDYSAKLDETRDLARRVFSRLT
jgi:hypothetical protein